MKKFENKIALILGGTSGIGKVTADQLIEGGATVHILGRNISKIIDQEGIIKHQIDITDQKQVQNIIKTISKNQRIGY